jgi:aminoglycoside/choline kinase family phosphotransferase
MPQINEQENMQALFALLHTTGLIEQREVDSIHTTLEITPLTGDGSSRQFWRIRRRSGEGLYMAVAPPTNGTEQDLQEARAARLIGVHLHAQGLPVPALYGWNEKNGLLLFEDLGEVKLHDLVLNNKNPSGTGNWQQGGKQEQELPVFLQAVQQLALMQIRGAEGFNDDWCWDTKIYDYSLMMQRESGYFLRAFWQDMLAQEVPPGIEEEFAHIAATAALAPAHFFLHRDFQSRNIMVCDGRVRFIDFQGGRRGPLGYDLASLLIDPYTALPASLQDELLQAYLDAMVSIHPINSSQFRQEYAFLAVQRNLQIIGAFSFLSKARGKLFFANFITPSLVSLAERLRQPELKHLRILPQMVAQGLKMVQGGS